MPEDPYSDPVTGVLYNKLGLGIAAGLEAAEREITHAALILLDESPVSPSYDLPHLQEIHKRIFGDIYEWAGQSRTVAIAKGAMFCLPQYIDSSAAVIFGELHDEDCLRGLSRDALVGRLAHYLRSQRPASVPRGQRAGAACLLRAARPRRWVHACLAAPCSRPQRRGLRRDHARRPRTDARDAGRAHEGQHLTIPATPAASPRLHRLFSQLKDHICLCFHNPQCKR